MIKFFVWYFGSFVDEFEAPAGTTITSAARDYRDAHPDLKATALLFSEREPRNSRRVSFAKAADGWLVAA